MNDLTNSLMTVSIPIAATERQQAEEFARQQPTPEKSDQIYRNTLAVVVTHRYLQMLAISSELARSHSWDRMERWLGNIADLYIPEVKGYLECRPVCKGDERCFVPEEVQRDRIGYVVVQLDEPYRNGILLGFMPEVSVTELPLSYLQPLDALIDRLTLPRPVSHLSQWLQRIFEVDWEPRAELLKSPKRPILQMCNLSVAGQTHNAEDIRRSIAQLYQQAPQQAVVLSSDIEPQEALVQLIQTTQKDEIRWQAAELLWEIDPNHPASPVVNTKDLGMYLAGHTVALMVGVLPKLDGRMLILLRVYPIQNESYLPTGLNLTGLDEAHNLLFEVESRHKDSYIQFKLTAEPGDQFSVRVALNDASVTETFLV